MDRVSEPNAETETGILQGIRDAYPGLSPSYAKVARYVLDNYQDVAFMTATYLAAKADVSESVVVRFAMHLGYSGYPDMRREIQAIVKSQLSPVARLASQEESEIHPGLSVEEIFKRTVHRDMMILEQTANLRENVEAVEKTVDAILGAHRVYCVGLGGLKNLAEMLSLSLGFLGYSTYRVKQGEVYMQHDLSHIREDDVVITFSYPRHIRRAIEALEIAKKAGATTVAITESFSSPAALVADIPIIAVTQKDALFNSYCSAISLINTLVQSCLMKDLERCRGELKKVEAMLPEDDFWN